MSENAVKETPNLAKLDESRRPADLRSRKLWWILPLTVLFLLLGVIYVLGHMGSADSEMYPTTERQCVVDTRSC